MSFETIKIYQMQVVSNAIVLAGRVEASQLNTLEAGQLNMSLNNVQFEKYNLQKRQDSNYYLANIIEMTVSDTSQVYAYEMTVQDLQVNSSLITYNLTANNISVTQKGKINSNYVNIKYLYGLNECLLELQNAKIQSLIFSTEIAVPNIRMSGTELQITNFIKGVLLAKIIYPKIYFSNAKGIINSDIYTSTMILFNSIIAFKSTEEHLEGEIKGLVDLVLMQSQLNNSYSRELKVEGRIVINDSIYHQNGTLNVSMLSAYNSSILINQSTDIDTIGLDYSNFVVNNQAIISTGEVIQSNFTVGSLKVRKYDGIQSVLQIPTIQLQQIIYNQQQEELLDIIAKQLLYSDAYRLALEQFCKINGSLCIDQGAQLQSYNIIATSIIANGSMTTSLLFRHLQITVSRLLYVVQEVYVKQIDLFFGTANRSSNLVQTGYLRLNKSLMIQNFYIDGTNIQINPRAYISMHEPLYTLTVMGVYTQSNDSSTKGEFGLFNQQTTIENITNTKGEIYINNSQLFTAPESSLYARKIVFSGQNATILGQISLQSNDRLHSTLEMKAATITLGTVIVHGQYPISRQKNCCGASNIIFGGCSQGEPASLIDLTKQVEYQMPPSGDVCLVNNLTVNGGTSGGGIVIKTQFLNLTSQIIANGEEGLCIDNFCGGSGSGGNIQITADILAFNSGVTLYSNGAGCQNESKSGGAGSAGQVIVKAGQYMLYTEQQYSYVKADQLKIQTENGQCHFQAVTPIDYCQSLFSVLDMSTMTCIIPWWIVLLIVLISTVIVCFIIFGIVCIVTICRDKRLEKDFDITKMSQMNQFVVQLEDLIQTTESSE